ncbi:AAA family ATPase [Lutispora thermophila]|uniref:MoxR-like ATPase n=1 Tax=Lutispora thermophila DSM 19022 TaxID=1122184 RepID=A0A1M6GDQ4_9FIRM|nr:MoxR family ATPase [Lutispora thermophila]SHJ08064.1 MoxR-like ATPase [Lutispora thermophila DSM 19022]
MSIEEKDIREAWETVKNIEGEVGKAIIGQKEVIRQVIMGLLSGGHILLEGAPGLGKTQLVKTLSKVLDLSFSRIQFTPDLMPADVIGTNIMVKDEEGHNKFEFHNGPVFSHLVLADEINRATPKTQSALLEAMQEATVTAFKTSYKLPSPFMVMATQNPIEMEGTYPLPEAQLDRFLFKIDVKFPNLSELKDIVTLTTSSVEADVKKAADGEKILAIREIAKAIPIAQPVLTYALKAVMYTHPENVDSPDIAKKYIRFGASPRAAQSIVNSARVRALLEGRYNVSFDDIQYVAYPALRHRIFMNYEGIAEGMDVDVLIKEILHMAEEQI